MGWKRPTIILIIKSKGGLRMERIVYNKTLDTHKAGVQFTLQGFETADKLSRRIVISLMANGDAIDLPLGQIEAVMYVTTPSGATPVIQSCIIKGNTIIYDVLPIAEEGITTMQLKLIEASGDGTPTVLATPRFAVEVIKSDTNDEGVNGVSYTAVEEAIARAKAVYDTRLLRIALDSDCVFTAYYGDGTVYESDVLKELFLKGDVLLSQSYAKGGSGVRDGEDTDNSMYYSQVAKSMALETKASGEDALAILDEVKKHGVYTLFSANFETGELIYESPKYEFKVNKETGELNIFGKAYTIEEDMVYVIEQWLKGFGVAFPDFKETVDMHGDRIQTLQETVDQHSEDIKTIDGEVVWESNITIGDGTPFGAITIEKDLTAYKSFRVAYENYSVSTTYGFGEQFISVKGIRYNLIGHRAGDLDGTTVFCFRGITITDTGIEILDTNVPYASASDRDNKSVRPYKIIGYKH